MAWQELWKEAMRKHKHYTRQVDRGVGKHLHWCDSDRLSVWQTLDHPLINWVHIWWWRRRTYIAQSPSLAQRKRSAATRHLTYIIITSSSTCTLQSGLYQLCLSKLHQHAVLQLASSAASYTPCSEGQRLQGNTLSCNCYIWYSTSAEATGLQQATPVSL